MDSRFIRRRIPRTFPADISVSVGNASSLPPSYQSAVNQVQVGTSAILGVVNIPAGFATTTTISAISPPTGFMITGNTLIWAPTMRGLQTLSIAVSDLPPSQTATLLITATGFQVLASVQGTLLIDSGLLNAAVVSTDTRFEITIPPAGITHPFVITATGIRGRNHTAVILTLTRNTGGGVDVGDTVSFNVIGGSGTYTLTIVAGSEQRRTVIAQANISGFSPLSLPPSMPFVVELALAANTGNPSTIPPFFAFLRRKVFVANPPPLIF